MDLERIVELQLADLRWLKPGQPEIEVLDRDAQRLVWLLCITHLQAPEKLWLGRVKKVQHDTAAELLGHSYETEALFPRPEAVLEDHAHASTEKLLRCRPLEILNNITQS